MIITVDGFIIRGTLYDLSGWYSRTIIIKYAYTITSVDLVTCEYRMCRDRFKWWSYFYTEPEDDSDDSEDIDI